MCVISASALGNNFSDRWQRDMYSDCGTQNVILSRKLTAAGGRQEGSTIRSCSIRILNTIMRYDISTAPPCAPVTHMISIADLDTIDLLIFEHICSACYLLYREYETEMVTTRFGNWVGSHANTRRSPTQVLNFRSTVCQ